MENLIATLIVYQHNVRMLHWTCKGKGFDHTHSYLDDFGKQIYDFTDEIAEIMISLDKKIPTLTEAMNILANDDTTEHLIITSEEFHDSKECAKAMMQMFTTLHSVYMKAYDEIKEHPGLTSTLDTHLAWIHKEGFYKMRLRLED